MRRKDLVLSCRMFFFFKQKTAYEMRMSYWSSDVCSSDLPDRFARRVLIAAFRGAGGAGYVPGLCARRAHGVRRALSRRWMDHDTLYALRRASRCGAGFACLARRSAGGAGATRGDRGAAARSHARRSRGSEEHTSELQSLMRTSYPVFGLQKKDTKVHISSI